MKEKTFFDLVSQVIQKADVSAILIGGFAVNHYGVMRQTQDVDFLMVEEAYDKVQPLFEKAGCGEVIRNNLFARLENKKWLPSELDIVFVNPETFEGILEESETAEIQGRKFKVPSLDHLLALKLHAMKQNLRRRGFRDITDVLDLARENRIDVKGKKFGELCLKYAGKEVYRIVQELLKNEEPKITRF